MNQTLPVESHMPYSDLLGDRNPRVLLRIIAPHLNCRPIGLEIAAIRSLPRKVAVPENTASVSYRATLRQRNPTTRSVQSLDRSTVSLCRVIASYALKLERMLVPLFPVYICRRYWTSSAYPPRQRVSFSSSVQRCKHFSNAVVRSCESFRPSETQLK